MRCGGVVLLGLHHDISAHGRFEIGIDDIRLHLHQGHAHGCGDGFQFVLLSTSTDTHDDSRFIAFHESNFRTGSDHKRFCRFQTANASNERFARFAYQTECLLKSRQLQLLLRRFGQTA